MNDHTYETNSFVNSLTYRTIGGMLILFANFTLILAHFYFKKNHLKKAKQNDIQIIKRPESFTYVLIIVKHPFDNSS